jgi:hypothetical protein
MRLNMDIVVYTRSHKDLEPDHNPGQNAMKMMALLLKGMSGFMRISMTSMN